MKMYCRKCGSPSDYSAKAPSFCGNCGNPMNASAARMGKMPDPEPEEEEESSYNTPSIDRLEVETETYNQSFKFGDIAGSTDGVSNEFQRQKPNEEQKKQMMNDFWNEAGKNQTPRDI